MSAEPIDIPGLDDDETDDVQPQATSRAWNVARTWWELTKLVLGGRGGYEMHLCVEDLPAGVQDVFDLDCWQPARLEWVGGRDAFVILTGEPRPRDLDSPVPPADILQLDLGRRIAEQEAERLRQRVEQLEREVEAERAENTRLLRASKLRGYDPGTAGDAPVSIGDAAHWRAEASRHRENAARLDNRLAAAEGREVR